MKLGPHYPRWIPRWLVPHYVVYDSPLESREVWWGPFDIAIERRATMLWYTGFRPTVTFTLRLYGWTFTASFMVRPAVRLKRPGETDTAQKYPATDRLMMEHAATHRIGYATHE